MNLFTPQVLGLPERPYLRPNQIQELTLSLGKFTGIPRTSPPKAKRKDEFPTPSPVRRVSIGSRHCLQDQDQPCASQEKTEDPSRLAP